METANTLATDLVVIGAGPGGYTAAIRGAQRGLDVVLVERETVGGVCVNHGCIPAKSLIHAAGFQKDIRQWNDIGIETGEVTVDFQAVQEWKNEVVRRLDEDILAALDQHDVTLLDGTARFRDSTTVVVDGETGDRTVTFDHAVVATGSQPLEIPGLEFDRDGVISSRDLLQVETVPDEIIVVGGGYIGMEAVTKFAKFGSSVRVVEARDRVLGAFEREVVDAIQETSEMYTDGIYTSALARGVEHEDGKPVLVVDHEGEERRFSGDYVVVAAGRDTAAARDRLALEHTAVELSDDGSIATDDQMRTTDDHIFAVGDAAGEPFLAHVAYREGKVAAAVAAGDDDSFDTQYVPAVMYTDPEVAVVGLSEAAAREAHDTIQVGRVPMATSGRALSANKPAGHVKVVADGEGTLLGAQVVGARASDTVAEATLALELDASLDDIRTTLHGHPTFPEALADAADDAVGESIHSH
ncbi:dihydrolipoyl dehydrogenase [Haloarcula sp. S1CR25-12]|uniref:Dihydrolipoyl dehydrogenase n=1 Tax=Haloarcula saliterrae TaxID=2950534 RepID=A0ABU2FIL2_9EURY|nr:dihydrolipoyl dehydrogenase [Haloarcula sp. S1CR25-12]MDS0261545.1 dihydrolipoyl dehydrogenase [Haloarcula sp. S1CR25-12]